MTTSDLLERRGRRFRLPRAGWGQLFGELWRVGLAAFAGAIFFGIRLAGADGSADTPGVPPAEGITLGVSPWAEVFTEWLMLDLLLGVVAVVLVLFRRRWPLAIALVTTCCVTFSSSAALACLICIASLATRGRRRDLYLVGPVFVLATLLTELIWPSAQYPYRWAASAISALVVLAATWSFGAYLGARRQLISTLREKADTLEREQALRVTQARSSERARIAQEMHDVLAHRISLIAVHANVLSYRTDLSQAQIAEHAGVVRENADRAVAELAGVLGVLRGGEGADNTAAPQPTLLRLADLLHDAKRAGTPAAIVGAMPDIDDLPDTTSRTAYRIVQECLTNARKHAGGLPVTVSIGGTEGVQLEITVKNALVSSTESGGGPVIGGTGMGLLGLAERVELAGGTFTSGPEDGFFVVRARLPWGGP